MARQQKQVRNLTSLLDVLEEKAVAVNPQNSAITFEDLLQLFGSRTYGPLLLVVGLISISPATIIPGATWAAAALTLALALQLALSSKRPWMPKNALKMHMSNESLKAFVSRARPTAAFVDRLIKPRLEFLADAPFVILIAILCMIAALITFPLGFIPLAPILPGAAIVLFGLGITARDGVLLALGAAITGGAAWLLVSRFNPW